MTGNQPRRCHRSSEGERSMHCSTNINADQQEATTVKVGNRKEGLHRQSEMMPCELSPTSVLDLPCIAETSEEEDHETVAACCGDDQDYLGDGKDGGGGGDGPPSIATAETESTQENSSLDDGEEESSSSTQSCTDERVDDDGSIVPTPIDDDRSIVPTLIETYELMEVPRKWSRRDPKLLDLSEDGDRWSAYAKFRTDVQNAADRQANNAEQGSYRDLIASGRESLRTLSQDLSCPYPKCMGAYLWPSSTYVRVKDAFCMSGKVRTLHVVSTTFSPYNLPRAIQIRHRYNTRSKKESSSSEIITARWEFRTIDFMLGGIVEERPWTPLCSIQVENDNRVRHLDTSNLTTETVLHIRGWLYGTVRSAKIIDDFALMQLVFASTFTSLTADGSTALSRRSIGLTWPSNRSDGFLMKKVLPDVDVEETSWLEYAVRKATGALRLQDAYSCQCLP